jgi:hypothetical protein
MSEKLLHLISMVRVAGRDIMAWETLVDLGPKTLSQRGCDALDLLMGTAHHFANTKGNAYGCPGYFMIETSASCRRSHA